MSQDALQQDQAWGAEQGRTDAIDAIVQQWRVERPDLDPSAKEITGRITRLASLFQLAYESAFAELELNDADYGVLAPLRRVGAPHELTPTELARQRMITSGGMTSAIDRLERKGLVMRVPNPADRRGSLVRLTDRGLTVIDTAMERHAAADQALVAGLGVRDRERLRTLLVSLLHSVESS